MFKCEQSTGQCAVTVVKADRTCVAVLDACEEYPTSHLLKVLEDPQSKNYISFYTTGFFIQTNYAALLAMAEFALSINGSMGYCFASEDVYESHKKETLEIMKYSDYLFCNKQEALAAAKHIGAELGVAEDETDLGTIARAMSLY